MKTLYEGNLNYKFAYRMTMGEKAKWLTVKVIETLMLSIISIPLAIYLWSWILM